MRKEFEMNQDELDSILNACKPVPYIVVGSYVPLSPQENANRAWQALAKENGFVWDTVQPCGKGDRFFTAEIID